MRNSVQMWGVILLAASLCAGCAHSPPFNPSDPLEPINRPIWEFNQFADAYVLRPIAQTYVDITPDPIEQGVDNFLSNLTYPVTIINDLFQLKLRHTAADLTRFLVNSTVGVLGIFDVAASLGLPERDEDFGQTLGYWGVGQGVYLMLPLLGPSTSRDALGRGVDYLLDPTFYIDETVTEWSLLALRVLNLRASLLGFDQAVRTAFDPYIFVRTVYLQHRRAAVYDGNPPPIQLQRDEQR